LYRGNPFNRFSLFNWQGDSFEKLCISAKDRTEKTEYFTKEERVELGKVFKNRKKIAPTHAHLFIPDKSPILETLASLIVTPVDKFLDLFKDYPESDQVEKVEKEGTENLEKEVNKLK